MEEITNEEIAELQQLVDEYNESVSLPASKFSRLVELANQVAETKGVTVQEIIEFKEDL